MAEGKERNWSSGQLVYEVREVYVYIPAELSAAGVELKIAGSVVIVNKEGQCSLAWWPTDLTQQDVACLYSSQTDDWTLVDGVVDAAVLVESREYADKHYKGGDLEIPDHILPPVDNTGEQSTDKVSGDNNGVTDSSSAQDVGSKVPMDAVNFELSQLQSIKETVGKNRSLTFLLRGGQELPSVYFHDGGSTGLLQSLQRYLYLEKDSKFPNFYFVKNFEKSQSGKPRPQPITETYELEEPSQAFKKITPHGVRGSKAMEVQGMIHEAVSGVVGNFVGITRAVRQHLLPEKQLLEVRPGTECDEDDDDERVIQTCVYSDSKLPSSPSSTSDSGTPENSPREDSSRHKPPRPPPSQVDNNSRKKKSAGDKATSDPEASLISDFQIITDIRGKLPPLPATIPRQPPVSADEWERLRDDEGRISKSKEQLIRARVFAGGIDLVLRKEAWKYLLNYYQFGMSDIERMEHRQNKEAEYWNMKSQWKAFSASQEKRFTSWREHKTLINKDVLRTDRDCSSYSSLTSPKLTQMEDILRTYVMYNFDLGYVQGMSDLLAPLLVIMDNEVDAFWCFVGFMDTVEHHFEESQENMRDRLKQLRALLNIIDPHMYQFLKEKDCNNLYFCFRWLLIHFKREFTYEDIMKIWEVIWTGYLSPDYSLFIALAVLQAEKNNLLNPKFDFSDILQHINGLSKHIPVCSVLELAEAICTQLGQSTELPDNLQTLCHKPLPSRPSLSSIPQVELDTIVCNPDSRAVPTSS